MPKTTVQPQEYGHKVGITDMETVSICKPILAYWHTGMPVYQYASMGLSVSICSYPRVSSRTLLAISDSIPLASKSARAILASVSMTWLMDVVLPVRSLSLPLRL